LWKEDRERAAGWASDDMTRGRPALSIVVGSNNARTSILQCLSSLIGQDRDPEVEIIVVDNSTDGTAELIDRHVPRVKRIPAPSSALIPELWATGVRESRGDIIAITTAHCVPRHDWVRATIEAHDGSAAAVGGAIEHDGSAGLADWAVYFCRYTSFMLPFSASFVAEIAGDNASYGRAHIDRYRHIWEDGFWEPRVHAELRRAGLRLLLTPRIVVSHRRSFDVPRFCRQRFLHGMRFGRDRAAELTPAWRLVYIALSPAIPLVFLARIARQVLTKARHRTKLMLALPLLLLFLAAWASGELLGYLRGPRA
jgi:glycosyltransferase involved in cell wall biosynthesis